MRERIEALLFEEAERLDAGDYAGWLALLTGDVRYEVPVPGAPEGGAKEVLHLIADDRARLEQRVAQLGGRHAWSEQPRSRTRRFVSNVRVREAEGGWDVRAALLIRRLGAGAPELYSGEAAWRVVDTEAGLRVAYRRVSLDDPVVGNLTFLP